MKDLLEAIVPPTNSDGWERMDLGEKIRKERKIRMMPLQDVSKKSGLSKSFISQIENGKANPSIASLKKVTDSLEIPLASLFEYSSAENNYKQSHTKEIWLVKAKRRKTMKMPNSNVEYFLLSPDLNRKREFLLTTADVGVNSGDEFCSHEGEECGVIVKGKVEFTIGGEELIMEEGDSIYFSSSLPHSWKNVGKVPAEMIWVITPPSF